jgi:hypothetical protein
MALWIYLILRVVRSRTTKGGKWYGETGCNALGAAGCSSIYIDKRDYTLQLKKNKNLEAKATNLPAKTYLEAKATSLPPKVPYTTHKLIHQFSP